MKKIVFSLMLLGTTYANAQQLLEVLRPRTGFTPSEKCLELVKDKRYGDGLHNFIYCAVQGPNGKKWLNLNLGAEYAREPSAGNPNPHFNPEAQPTDYNDWKAFGNLYQWGRDSDGHELVEYKVIGNKWYVKRVNGVRNSILLVGESSNQMVVHDGSNGLYYTKENVSFISKNPCPEGYHVATTSDIISLGKFNYTGDNTTPSVIYPIQYGNMNIITSPSLEPEGVVIGWNDTDTTTSEAERGTSSIWLGDRWEWSQRERYNINGDYWRDSTIGMGGAMLDHGFHAGGKKGYGIWPVQGEIVIQSYLTSMALRCVQD